VDKGAASSEQRAGDGGLGGPSLFLELGLPEALESPAHPHGQSRYRCNPRDGRRVCMGQRQQQPRLRALAACLPVHILALIAAQAAIDDQHRVVTSSVQSHSPVSSGWDSSMRKLICPCLAACPHSLLAACCCPSFLSPHYNPPLLSRSLALFRSAFSCGSCCIPLKTASSSPHSYLPALTLPRTQTHPNTPKHTNTHKHPRSLAPVYPTQHTAPIEAPPIFTTIASPSLLLRPLPLPLPPQPASHHHRRHCHHLLPPL
jgi:hypothetical protein